MLSRGRARANSYTEEEMKELQERMDKTRKEREEKKKLEDESKTKEQLEFERLITVGGRLDSIPEGENESSDEEEEVVELASYKVVDYGVREYNDESIHEGRLGFTGVAGSSYF